MDGQRYALAYVLRGGVGVDDGKIFKGDVVARNAKGVRAEGVVFQPVRVDFAGVVAVGYHGVFALTDNRYVVCGNFRFGAVYPFFKVNQRGFFKAVYGVLYVV